MKKVFVSGCFDLLHSGHVMFLHEAAALGELYVGVGSDETVKQLKGQYPICTAQERQFIIRALRDVHDCLINSGSGRLDFQAELQQIKPDIFVVNQDGDTPEKRRLCLELGIEYLVKERKPFADLPARSTTGIKEEIRDDVNI